MFKFSLFKDNLIVALLISELPVDIISISTFVQVGKNLKSETLKLEEVVFAKYSIINLYFLSILICIFSLIIPPKISS